MSATSQDEQFILITQCLQNTFFLAAEDQLRLPIPVVGQMLLGTADDMTSGTEIKVNTKTNKREISKSKLKNGPLYQFLKAVIEGERDHPLHVIHIKDWHQRTDSYDRERRLYGPHCEADTWAAKPIDGFEEYLSPWPEASTAQRSKMGYEDPRYRNTTFYEIRSDSVFDFKPPQIGPDPHHPYRSPPPEDDPTGSGLSAQQNTANGQSQSTATSDVTLEDLLDKLIGRDPGPNKRVYVIVIGVYTDIKVTTLLSGLRSRYPIPNLIVSDILTAAPNLERHLAGLDFADKVLGVEVVHSLNDLAAVINKKHPYNIPATTFKGNPDFRDYASYYLDKQRVLAFQDTKLAEYLDLTTQRSTELYTSMRQISRYLMWIGFASLILTLVFSIASFADPNRFDASIPFLIGGLSITSLITVFLYQPRAQQQANLLSLVRLRNYLETYSTITALIRHHFTTPEFLNDALKSRADSKKLNQTLDRVERQIDIILKAAEGMGDNFNTIAPKIPQAEESPNGRANGMGSTTRTPDPNSNGNQNKTTAG